MLYSKSLFIIYLKHSGVYLFNLKFLINPLPFFFDNRNFGFYVCESVSGM